MSNIQHHLESGDVLSAPPLSTATPAIKKIYHYPPTPSSPPTPDWVASLLALAEANNVPDPERIAVYLTDSPASFSGGFRFPLLNIDSRFITLSTGAFRYLDPSSTRIPFAAVHELGHVAADDPLVLVGVKSGLCLAVSLAARAGYARAQSILHSAIAVACLACLAAPGFVFLSHFQETRADAFAARQGYGRDGIAALTTYALFNDIDPRNDTLSHPSINTRILRLLRYLDAHSTDPSQDFTPLTVQQLYTSSDDDDDEGEDERAGAS